MVPETAWEDDFNRWYDDEHVPVRMEAPGFLSAQRYRRDDGTYLVMYDMAGPATLTTEQYLTIKDEPSERTSWMLANVGGFTRHLARELGTSGSLEAAEHRTTTVFTILMSVPDDELAELDAWYVAEHAPMLLECEDWLAVRRFALSGEPARYNRLAVHYLASPEALNSPERAAARDTEWRKRLGERDWFSSPQTAVWRPHGPRSHGTMPLL
ncbi:hypothetical protein [Streptosporangium sp. NPDC051022]|uniref:hypothetical protein n=1 Tax=Streptosporangium sp. NPDC051022 TaxID=3155752 RepID=UPI00341203B0